MKIQSIRNKALALIVSLFAFGFSNAQQSDVGNWIIYFGNQRINEKWNWWNEVQYRNYNFIGDLRQLLLRTGIGYDLTENNNNVLAGYAYIASENYIEGTNEKKGFGEHRLYQQFITRQNYGRVFLQHRYRIEERFIEDQDFELRFRYFLSVNIPLNNKAMLKDTFFLSAYNEIFINHDTPAFDQNRLYGGIGYVISKTLRVEAGFMSQAFEGRRMNQFNIFFHNNIPFKQKNRAEIDKMYESMELNEY